jgi:hypothetical protein
MYEIDDAQVELIGVLEEIGFNNIHAYVRRGEYSDDLIDHTTLYAGDDHMGGYLVEIHIKYYKSGMFAGAVQVRVIYTDIDGTEWSSAFACREAGDARIGMLFDCDGMQESFFDALTKVFLASK